MCFFCFCFFIQLNSSYAIISFPWLHVRAWMCAYSLYQIPERMFMSLMNYTRSFLYHCTGVLMVFSLQAFRLLLIPAPLGGNVAIHCDLQKPCTLGIFVIISQGSSPFNTLLCYFWPQSHCCVLIVFRCGKLSLCNWKNNSFSVWKSVKREKWKCPAVIWWMPHTNVYM